MTDLPASPFTPDPSLGPTGDRRYAGLGLLRHGGTAYLYRAYDAYLQREVAIKVPHSDDPAALARLEREAEVGATAALRGHPGLCMVDGIEMLGDRRCLVMELVHGEELGWAAARLAPRDRIAIVRDVARTLHAVHEAGWVHRDVKPSNVMLRARIDPERAQSAPTPVLVDFGLAQVERARAEDRSGAPAAQMAVVGTPAYLA
ncbi:MAG: protein kinase, partial [Acidobacteriota bacterium]